MVGEVTPSQPQPDILREEGYNEAAPLTPDVNESLSRPSPSPFPSLFLFRFRRVSVVVTDLISPQLFLAHRRSKVHTDESSNVSLT